MDHNAYFRSLREGCPRGAFLFHGEEEYIKRRALEALTALLDPASRELNMAQYRSPLFQDVQEACETLPFFSERRLVVCYDMPESEMKLLAPYVKTMPESTILVLYMKGNVKKDLAKPFAHGEVTFRAMNEQEALRFVEKRARERGVAATAAVLRKLIEMAGVEAYALENAFFNAADYAGESGVITEEILERCVTPHIEYEAFRIIDKLAAGKKAEALCMLRHVIKQDAGSAFMLAHVFSRQVKSMLNARQLLDCGVQERDIAARMGLKPWSARSALGGAKRMTQQALKAAVAAFTSVDFLQVSGRMPADRSLELAIMKHFH